MRMAQLRSAIDEAAGGPVDPADVAIVVDRVLTQPERERLQEAWDTRTNRSEKWTSYFSIGRFVVTLLVQLAAEAVHLVGGL